MRRHANAYAARPSRSTSETWSTALLCSLEHFSLGLVQDDAFEWIDIVLPRCLIECSHGRLVSRLPAGADAGRTEVDILCVIFVLKLRGKQPHHVHHGRATVGCEFARGR